MNPLQLKTAKTALVVFTTLFIAHGLFAQTTVTWETNPASGNMSTSGNWQGGSAPTSGDSWAFTNSSVSALTNNFATNWTVGGITFLPNSAGYSMSGNAFSLGGNILNQSSSTITISNNISINSAVAVSNTPGRMNLKGVLSGNGSLTKNGTGALFLGGNSTFSGGVTLNEGIIRQEVNQTVSSGIVTGGSFGTGTLTINGGKIMPGGAGALYFPTMLVNSNFSVNTGVYNNTDNGRASFAGIMNLAGGTRTITLGRWTNALGSIKGGQESWRFFSNNLLAATITNGTVRFTRDSDGTDNDYVGVNFSAGMRVASDAGIIVGSNVITSFTSSDPWGTSTNPAVAVEGGGYFNISSDVNARNVRVKSLSGSGVVTSLAAASGAQTSTLTVSNTSTADSSTFSGRLVEGNLLNSSLGTSATNVTLALTKAGSGTLTLSGSNNYSGTTTISGGALQIGDGGTSGSLGASGSLVNNATLIFNRSDNIAQGTDFNSAGISGSGAVIKLDTGTVTFNAGNSYSGTTDISNGAVRISNATGLGATNGGTTVRSGAALELAGGISVGSEALTLNGTGVSSGGALRNVGGDNTYGGTMTIGSASLITADAGSLTLSTAIANGGFALSFGGAGNITSAAISGAGALAKSGNGTLTMANSSYTGKTTINGGTISVGADSGVGAAPGVFVADQITLSGGGKLLTKASFVMNANRGITLGAGGGGIEVAEGITTSNPANQIISGNYSLTKSGVGTLQLGAANTFAGGFVLNDGFVRLQSSSVLSGGNIASGALGVGNVTINGGGIYGGGQTLNATNITVNDDFAVNSGTSGLNGRLSLGADLINLTGGTRTVSLGRLSTASAVLTGGQESLRFITNSTYFAPVITNGSFRFVRDESGTPTQYASVTFGSAGIQFTDGTGFIVGSNIITQTSTGGAFSNANNSLPHVTTEAGGVFNIGTSNNVNSPSIRSLTGSAGFVTALATMSTATNAILVISNQAGDNYTYSGQIVDGSSLNSTLGTTATNVAFTLHKRGEGTQVLNGSNTYSGTTLVQGGVLVVNGDQSGAVGNVQVNSGAIMGGSGTIGGATTINGSLRPGNSIGALTVANDVTWNGGNDWIFELGASAPTLSGPSSQDQLLITGVGSDFLKGTGSTWAFDFAGTGELGFYQLVSWSGTTDFLASNFTASNLGGGNNGVFIIQDDSLYLEVVPEPSTYALLCLAGLGLAAHVIRRRHTCRE
jgi:autotransporter-associated beta strand protein